MNVIPKAAATVVATAGTTREDIDACIELTHTRKSTRKEKHRSVQRQWGGFAPRRTRRAGPRRGGAEGLRRPPPSHYNKMIDCDYTDRGYGTHDSDEIGALFRRSVVFAPASCMPQLSIRYAECVAKGALSENEVVRYGVRASLSTLRISLLHLCPKSLSLPTLVVSLVTRAS